MARAIVDGQLSRRGTREIRFALAQPADDPAIRRLLRDNPMHGAISLSLEREPNYFAGESIAGRDETILAWANEQVVCMGRCTTRHSWINGEIKRTGYLGELRLDASVRGRVDLLRGGYDFFRQLHQREPADFYFTSIAADNFRARRLLERGARELPTYTFISEFVTALIPVPRRARLPRVSGLREKAGTSEQHEEIATFLNSHAARHQLASAWTAERLRALSKHGLAAENFHLIYDRHQLVGCVGLWDQREFRQTVVRGYSSSLRRFRLVLNFGARWFGGVRLPPVGSIVPHAYASPLAIEPGYEAELAPLIHAAFSRALQRGIELLTLGFASDDPRLEIMCRHFSVRTYRSRLYQVTWPDESASLSLLPKRLAMPDVALL